MKKLLLLSICSGLGLSVFAQGTYKVSIDPKSKISNSEHLLAPGVLAARTTAIGDTEVLSHITSADTPAVYYVGSTMDSGAVFGPNAFGDLGFAERYDIDSADSTVEIIGEESFFSGDIRPTSTKTISFYVTGVAAQSAVGSSTDIFDSGLPSLSNLLDSLVDISITSLGIDTAGDTGNAYLFNAPTTYLRKSFFIGYIANYAYDTLNGDTIALYSDIDGERTSPGYTVSGSDTIVNDVNVTLLSTYQWVDNYEEGRFGIYNNLEIFPIVKIGNGTLAVKGITRNDFTFFGNYPNPAVNSTNIKFSLAQAADVTITITDMSGHTISTIKEPNMGAGEHIVPVSTANMASGEYLYTIRTSEGDGIASALTVVR